MNKETVKKVVKAVGAFGTGAYGAIPVAFYSAIVKGHPLLKASMLVAGWGISVGMFEEYVEPTLDDLVDSLIDDDPDEETVTEG